MYIQPNSCFHHIIYYSVFTNFDNFILIKPFEYLTKVFAHGSFISRNSRLTSCALWPMHGVPPVRFSRVPLYMHDCTQLILYPTFILPSLVPASLACRRAFILSGEQVALTPHWSSGPPHRANVKCLVKVDCKVAGSQRFGANVRGNWILVKLAFQSVCKYCTMEVLVRFRALALWCFARLGMAFRPALKFWKPNGSSYYEGVVLSLAYFCVLLSSNIYRLGCRRLLSRPWPRCDVVGGLSRPRCC